MTRWLIGLLGWLYASSVLAIEWYHDYDKALEAAAKEQKILYIIIVTDDCRWCRKMEATTLKDPMVDLRISKRYISLELNRDRSSYPDSLQAKMVPKHYFLTPQGGKIFTVPGYWNVEDFLATLDDVERRYTHLKPKEP
ncbi:MAG: thioredoxin family protein [Campylobacterales bacterium]|nr:thioredoxin family protein [Campylobacterales bacterium]